VLSNFIHSNVVVFFSRQKTKTRILLLRSHFSFSLPSTSQNSLTFPSILSRMQQQQQQQQRSENPIFIRFSREWRIMNFCVKTLTLLQTKNVSKWNRLKWVLDVLLFKENNMRWTVKKFSNSKKTYTFSLDRLYLFSTLQILSFTIEYNIIKFRTMYCHYFLW